MRPRAARIVRHVPLIALASVTLVGLLAVGTARQLVLGSRAIEDSDVALSKGDHIGAVLAARAAAEARVPGSPYPERGYKRLEAIAREAEARGDDELASSAWRATRAAALETRSLGSSGGEWLARSNESLARIGGRKKNSPLAQLMPAQAYGEARPEEEALLTSLRRDETPPASTFLLLFVGALALLAGMGRVAWLSREPLLIKRARVPAMVAACGLVLYLVACVRG